MTAAVQTIALANQRVGDQAPEDSLLGLPPMQELKELSAEDRAELAELALAAQATEDGDRLCCAA